MAMSCWTRLACHREQAPLHAQGESAFQAVDVLQIYCPETKVLHHALSPSATGKRQPEADNVHLPISSSILFSNSSILSQKLRTLSGQIILPLTAPLSIIHTEQGLAGATPTQSIVRFLTIWHLLPPLSSKSRSSSNPSVTRKRC